MAASLPAETAAPPRPFRVARRRRETADTWTLELEPVTGERLDVAPGQFTMLYAFGIGEVPISVSGPAGAGPLVHTVRAVGAVSRAIAGALPGATLGVRGPFGRPWPVEDAAGQDVVFVAGGIGLAPLRPALYHVLASRAEYGSVTLLYGGRTPADLLFRRELEHWRSRLDVDVDVTVDAAVGDWYGKVGVVTQLMPRAAFDPAHTAAFVCGPEIMMRFAARSLLDRGLTSEQVWLSLERNMQCAVGHCGHCQLGTTLVCRDGPVYRFDLVEQLLGVREL